MIGSFGGDGGKLGFPLLLMHLKTYRNERRERRGRRGMKAILCSCCHDCCNNDRIAIFSFYVFTTMQTNSPITRYIWKPWERLIVELLQYIRIPQYNSMIVGQIILYHSLNFIMFNQWEKILKKKKKKNQWETTLNLIHKNLARLSLISCKVRSSGIGFFILFID